MFGLNGNYMPPLIDPSFDRVKILDELTHIYNDDMFSRRVQRWQLINLDRENVYDKIANENIGFIKNYRDMTDVLTGSFPGELFAAGGAILKMFYTCGRVYYESGDVDLFLCCKSEQRAIEIITHCIGVLKQRYAERKIRITRSKGALTFIAVVEGGGYYETMHKFQFIHRLYSHPSQIIGMFDLGPCQLLYSKSTGLQTTRMGNFCLDNRIIILDPSRRSTSYVARLHKYSGRGFKVLVPNLITDSGYIESINSLTNLNALCVDTFHYFFAYSTGKDHWQEKAGFKNDDYNEGDSTIFSLIRPIFLHVPLTDATPLVVKNDDTCNWMVDLRFFDQALHNPEEFNLYPANIDLQTVGSIKALLKIDPHLNIMDFINGSLNADEWKKHCLSLIEKRLSSLENFFAPYQEGGFFKIANPGQQGGGSFQPTVMSGRDFWDVNVVNPIFVGISHEIYFLIKMICREYMPGYGGTNRDVINIICFFYLRAISL